MANSKSPQLRIALLLALLAVALVAVVAVDPIPQDLAYHEFADARGLWGVPNFGDVMSNLAFAAVGLSALFVLQRHRAELFASFADARPYIVFFIGVTLVSVGSAYYHWEPSNERLLWDRLPMSIAFMAISSAVVADRINASAGNGWLLIALLTFGLASLLYWDWTESQGRGDLRFYGLVQFYPMLALPVICWLYPKHRYTRVRWLLWVLGWYGLSKLFEFLDVFVFEATGRAVSGHTLKHLAAAVATFMVLPMISDHLQTARSARGSTQGARP